VDAAESKDLQQCLKLRQQQGERILGELEAAFNELEEAPGRKKNTAAEGLINGAREHIAELEEGPALDAVLIADVQKTEHYCIAAWGTAKSLASTLEMRTTVRAMDRALEEGKELDGKLTKLAQDEITPSLMAQEVEEVEEEEGDAARPEAGGSGRSRKSRRRTRGGASH
jgi:ferritin-like metal-binding protein YciE